MARGSSSGLLSSCLRPGRCGVRGGCCRFGSSRGPAGLLSTRVLCASFPSYGGTREEETYPLDHVHLGNAFGQPQCKLESIPQLWAGVRVEEEALQAHWFADWFGFNFKDERDGRLVWKVFPADTGKDAEHAFFGLMEESGE